MKKLAVILLLLVLCLPSALFAGERKAPTLGVADRGGSALIGILYDFKQDQKRHTVPTDRNSFEREVAAFIDRGFDEGMLNKYYRVPRPMYTTELWIDTIDADTAPKAFGVEKTVQPWRWMVHYKGQVTVPEDGVYRFLGDADDFVAVAVNGKTVLVNVMAGTANTLKTKWYAKEKFDLEGVFTAGDWIELKAGKPFDMDVVTGDSPGGQFRCLLAVQKKGATYRDRRPPRFQLAVTRDTQPGVLPWKGVQ